MSQGCKIGRFELFEYPVCGDRQYIECVSGGRQRWLNSKVFAHAKDVVVLRSIKFQRLWTVFRLGLKRALGLELRSCSWLIEAQCGSFRM